VVTRLADASTEAVLGSAALLAALDPDCHAAREAARAPRCFTAADLDAWTIEIAACQAAERWINADAAAHAACREALSQLPSPDAPARRLHAAEPLAEGDLFTVKRLLYFGHAASSAALPLLSLWHDDALAWPPRLSDLMAAIHPEPAPSPRFHLAASLDPALVSLRQQLQDARRAARELRQPREAALRQDYGVAFDFEGALRLPASATPRASQDPRLRPRRDAWELADPAVDAAQLTASHVEAACRDAEQALLVRLSDDLRASLPLLLHVAAALADLDLRLARARLKARIDGCWPQWRHDTPGASMSAAIDPRLKARNPAAQAVDLEVATRPVIITGPNMGGKSSSLKLLGLCQWAMQHALPAPARAFSAAPVASLIYVGSDEPHADSAAPGLSSFGREVQRLVSSLADTPAPRLWLLDEIGRGTHPDEGASLARRLISRLSSLHDRVAAATHFPAVAAMPDADRWRVAGLDRAAIQAALAQLSEPDSLARILSKSMNYSLLRADAQDDAARHDAVPRDALLVAELLGLELP
jgi:hypothetical protein